MTNGTYVEQEHFATAVFMIPELETKWRPDADWLYFPGICYEENYP